MKLLAQLGSSGKWSGNMWRDFERQARKAMEGHELRTWPMKLPMHHRRSRNILDFDFPIVFPHETYAYLAEKPAALLRRVYGGDVDSARKWWLACRNDAWYPHHPAATFTRGDVVAPLRLYGDDAEHFKNQSCLIMTWSSPLCRLPVAESRMLICAVPLAEMVDDVTLNEIGRYIKWSFECLWEGRWPRLDPDGEPWPRGSERARRGEAGDFLDPEFRSRALVAQVAGDWKFLKEGWRLPRHYNKRECCHQCLAVHHGDGPPMDDFSEEAEWASTSYTHEDYFNDLGDNIPFLALLPYFFLCMVTVDVMHMLHLGILAWAIGSELVVLCDRGFFGTYRGDRKVRLDKLLERAYERFKAYCRSQSEGHSQPLFTSASIGRSESNAVYPELKAKASNARVVTQWLWSELRDSDAPESERLLFWSLNETLCLLHGRVGATFVEQDRDDFVYAARTALLCNAQLAREAGAATNALWPIKPKHHAFAHVVAHVRLTSRIPAWCFADEDYNGKVVMLAKRVHRKGVGIRVAFAFCLRLWSQLWAVD